LAETGLFAERFLLCVTGALVAASAAARPLVGPYQFSLRLT
jgi:hypothetical protein